ncbi:hypothetical protein N9R24_00015 [Amylibacter sp.]|nr:hypothetical protein [Amylibacter sp.]
MVHNYYKRFEKLTNRSLKTPLFLASIASLLDGLGMGLCLVLLQRITDIQPDIHIEQNFETIQFDSSLNVWVQSYLGNATPGLSKIRKILST